MPESKPKQKLVNKPVQHDRQGVKIKKPILKQFNNKNENFKKETAAPAAPSDNLISAEKEAAKKKRMGPPGSVKFKKEESKIEKREETKPNKKGKKGAKTLEDDEEVDFEPIVKAKPKPKNKPQKSIKQKDVYLPPFIKLANLAKLLGVNYSLMRRRMIESGLPDHPYDYLLSADDASVIAMAFNLNPIEDEHQAKDIYPQSPPSATDPDAPHPLRAPVVTIMGHVDHGKTTLLDTLRKSSVAAGEAGGITQHVGAFKVELKSGQSITFLDTPGHAAFRNMRSRGAHVTDIVVLVIAADDGIMPQTIEAIQHSLEAEVPIIVALTKCDKPTKNIKQIKEDLMQHNVQLEEFGGDTPVVEIAAPTGKGIVELEETISTLAEVLDLRAPKKGGSEAVVLESNIDRGLGPVATVVVGRGTLKPGQYLVAGESWCKIKSLTNENGKIIKEALPGSPARVSGWRNMPKAGDLCLQAKNEDEAKVVISNRSRVSQQNQEIKDMIAINEKRQKEYELLASMDETNEAPLNVEDELPILPIVIKGDVSGTVEAIEESIAQFPDKKVKAKVILRGVGPVTKADLDVALAAKGIIVTFNIKTDKDIIQLAQSKKIDILSHKIIYSLLEDIKKRMVDLLPITYQYVEEAKVEIVKLFSMKLKNRSGLTNIAGCKVVSGTLQKSHFINIYRPKGKDDKIKGGSGELIKENAIISVLKVFKEDVEQVKSGSECAIELNRFDQYKEGDKLLAYNRIEAPRML
ncbi:initiation factor 2 [Neoconidiobolus thromboides FSU 785]|nr:initiation factor 2 [Neoconidiobolus thromboides FSU 785]